MPQDDENLNPEDQASADKHLADAKEFFDKPNPNLEPKHEEKVPEKKESKEEGKPSEEDDLLNSIGFKKPAKPEEKKEEPKHEDDEDFGEIPEDSPNHANWKKLNESRSSWKARAEAAEAKLQDAPDDAATETLRARNKELEAQNEAYSSKIKQLDFKSHPDYFDKYEKPIEGAQATLKEIAEMEGVDVNVESLAKLTGREFNQEVSDIIDRLTRVAGDEFSQVARDLRKKISERDAVSQDADKFIQEANDRFQAETRAVFDEVSTVFSETLVPLEVPADADDGVKAEVEAYNGAIGEVPKIAEQIAFGGLDNREIAQIANEAAQYRFLINHGLPRLTQNAGAKIAALSSELKSIKEAGPRYTPRNSSNSDKSMASMGHEEAAKMAFQS